MCVTIQRGTTGAVEDAILWQNMPTWNDGARLTLSTGTSASGGTAEARAVTKGGSTRGGVLCCKD